MSFNENGRTMIEMLGVLAIVAVLSIAGITGFSKAMMKHKLNKQAEAFNLLFDSIDMYKTRLIREKHDSMDLTSVFQSLGAISDGLTLDGNRLYDGFSNRIRIYTNMCVSSKLCTEIALSYESTKQSNFAICNNIFQIAIARSSSLFYFTTASRVEDNSSVDYANKLYGDKYCSVACLRDITFDDIYEICNSCIEKKSCSHIFIWRS